MATERSQKYTQTDKSADFYSDFTRNLMPHPGNKQLIRITNEDAVKNSILNLINTDKYSRPFQPLVGCNLRKLLFKNVSAATANEIDLAILETIKNYEPRAGNVTVQSISDPSNHSYNVVISFFIKNKAEPVSFSQILYRVR